MKFERDFRYLIMTTLLVFIALPAQATVITIGELAGETPTATYNAPAYTPGNGPYIVDGTAMGGLTSYSGYQPAGPSNPAASQASATFSVPVTLNSVSTLGGAAFGQENIIWETGADAIGWALAYDPNGTSPSGMADNPTLELLLVSGSAENARISYALSSGQLDTELNLTWTINLSDNGAERFMSLFVDGAEVGNVAHSVTIWSGSNAAGYGGPSGTNNTGQTAFGVDGSTIAQGVEDQGWGTINNTTGLRYYYDTAVVIPEPTTGALLLAGLGYLALRRRS